MTNKFLERLSPQKKFEAKLNYETHRAQRDMCGEWWAQFDARTGRLKYIEHHCGHCMVCHMKKAEEIGSHMKRGMDKVNGFLKTVLLKEDDAEEFTREYGMSHYYRIPVENDCCVLFINSKVIHDERYDQDVRRKTREMDTLFEVPSQAELAEIISRKDYRKGQVRVTGSFGKNTPISDDEDKGEEHIIEERAFTFRNEDGKPAPKQVTKKVAELTVAETADLDPQTAEETQEAYDKRTDTFLENMKGAGYEPNRTQVIRRKLYDRDLGQWDKNYAQGLKSVYNYFLLDKEAFLLTIGKITEEEPVPA